MVRHAGRRGAALVAAAATAMAASACTAAVPSDPSGGLAVVVGGRANMPAAQVSGTAAQVVVNAVDTRSAVAVVVADGAPFVADDARVADLAADDGGDEARRDVIDAAMDEAAARTPEADLLSALDLAAREIEDEPGRRTVLVVDSGLSTAGALDLRRPGLLDADPADLVASLAADRALPDLGGTHVVFQGLGDTAAPQPVLGGVVREQLVDLWTAIALGAGALDVTVERAALSGSPRDGLPPVGVVAPGDGGVSCSENTVVLAGGDVAFEADSATFQDPGSASEILRPIAGALAVPGVTAVLTGTTADVGDAQGQRRLSAQRATAVADLLVELGVPRSRMTVEGLGSDFPGYVPDRDRGGELLPAEAARNRKVVIELAGGERVVCD